MESFDGAQEGAEGLLTADIDGVKGITFPRRVNPQHSETAAFHRRAAPWRDDLLTDFGNREGIVIRHVNE